MARISTNRIAWTYTADDGTEYRVAAEKGLTDQAKQGGADGSGVALAKPASLKMRRVTCRTSTGISRTFPLYEVGAALATAGETISANVNTDSLTFTSRGNPIPQSHQRENVTSQNA